MRDARSKKRRRARPARPSGRAPSAPRLTQRRSDRDQRACLAGQRDRPADRARRLSARHHPAQRGANGRETFDVSRSAVREAIKMLMAKSLLASRPKIGSWVEPQRALEPARSRRARLVRDVARPRGLPEDRAGIPPHHRAGSDRASPPSGAATSRWPRSARPAATWARPTTLQERTRRRHALPSRHPARLGQRAAGAARRADRIGAQSSLRLRDAARSDDLRHVQKLHEAIEKNIRLQRPAAARNAVRKLLANTDEGIGRSRR